VFFGGLLLILLGTGGLFAKPIGEFVAGKFDGTFEISAQVTPYVIGGSIAVIVVGGLLVIAALVEEWDGGPVLGFLAVGAIVAEAFGGWLPSPWHTWAVVGAVLCGVAAVGLVGMFLFFFVQGVREVREDSASAKAGPKTADAAQHAASGAAAATATTTASPRTPPTGRREPPSARPSREPGPTVMAPTTSVPAGRHLADTLAQLTRDPDRVYRLLPRSEPR
jgi:hypothetical protein